MKKNKNNYTLLIIISFILLSILGILYFDESEDEEIKVYEPNYFLLDDYSRFFTVDSVVYKYINILVSKNKNNLISVLDEDYITINNITKDNVDNYIEFLDGIYSFKSKKIYYEKVSKDFIKYYVYGYLIQEQIDSNGIKNDYYLIVNMDLKNQLFSITPDNGTKFKEVSNG